MHITEDSIAFDQSTEQVQLHTPSTLVYNYNEGNRSKSQTNAHKACLSPHLHGSGTISTLRPSLSTNAVQSSASCDRLHLYSQSYVSSDYSILNDFLNAASMLGIANRSVGRTWLLDCNEWAGSITALCGKAELRLTRRGYGHVEISMDPHRSSPTFTISVIIHPSSYGFHHYADDVAAHTNSARRDAQEVLTGLIKFMNSCDSADWFKLGIASFDPEPTVGVNCRLGENLRLCPYYPYVDDLNIKNASMPVDLSFPKDEWNILQSKMNKSNDYRSHVNVLIKESSLVNAAMLMMTTKSSQRLKLGFMNGKGSRCRAKYRSFFDRNGSETSGVNPRNNSDVKGNYADRTFDVYDKTLKLESDEENIASRSYKTGHQGTLDACRVIRFDGQQGRELLRKNGMFRLLDMLDQPFNQIAKHTLFPISIRVKDLSGIRSAIGQKIAKNKRLTNGEAHKYLKICALVIRYFCALANEIGVETHQVEVPSPKSYGEFIGTKNATSSSLIEYVNQCFSTFNDALESSVMKSTQQSPDAIEVTEAAWISRIQYHQIRN